MVRMKEERLRVGGEEILEGLGRLSLKMWQEMERERAFQRWPHSDWSERVLRSLDIVLPTLGVYVLAHMEDAKMDKKLRMVERYQQDFYHLCCSSRAFSTIPSAGEIASITLKFVFYCSRLSDWRYFTGIWARS